MSAKAKKKGGRTSPEERQAPPRRPSTLLVLIVIPLALFSLWFFFRPSASVPAAPSPTAGGTEAGEPGIERLQVKVLSVRPHDPAAYTQGLVWDRGSLYESTGLYGGSSLREVDPASGQVRRQTALSQGSFGEGLALAGDRLIQLTWQEGVAFEYRAATFEKLAEHRYQGEGWGLCFDGSRLVMSDGSDRLTFRDPQTFAALREVHVRFQSEPVGSLNELECAEGAVYANVWQRDEILRIDPESGRVTAVIDASGLLTPEERNAAEVLNGIAYLPDSKTFLLTGKLWPKMFEVSFIPSPR